VVLDVITRLLLPRTIWASLLLDQTALANLELEKSQVFKVVVSCFFLFFFLFLFFKGDELVPIRVSLPGLQSVSCGWLHTLLVVESKAELVQGRVNMLGLFAMLPRDVLQFLLRKFSPVALCRLS